MGVNILGYASSWFILKYKPIKRLPTSSARNRTNDIQFVNTYYYYFVMRLFIIDVSPFSRSSRHKYKRRFRDGKGR